MTASPGTPVELICLPPAGGSAASFRSWARLAPAHVTVRTLARTVDHRRAGTDLAAVAEVHAGEIADLPALVAGRTRLLVGHSLGGLLAYETVRRLEELGCAAVDRVVVMGTRPPHLSSADFFAPLIGLDDRALLEALALLGVVHPMLRDSPLRGLFLPALRADLALIAGYRPLRTPPLDLPLAAWHAANDELAPPDLGDQWCRYTRTAFDVKTFAGDHFFPVQRAREALRALLALGGPTAGTPRPARGPALAATGRSGR